MGAVTDAQIQTFVDNRVRPRCTETVTLILKCQSDIANIDDIYANLNSSPTWVDANGSKSLHTAVPNDVLAWNTFIQQLVGLVTGAATDANATLSTVQAMQGQWPIIKKLPTFQVP